MKNKNGGTGLVCRSMNDAVLGRHGDDDRPKRGQPGRGSCGGSGEQRMVRLDTQMEHWGWSGPPG
jgi:hypothetical protein